MSRLSTIKVLTLFVFVTACSNDSDNTIEADPSETSTSQATDNSANTSLAASNLKMDYLETNTLNAYTLGETIRIDYQLEVAELTQPDVELDFYLVHADSDNEQEIEHVYLLDKVTHYAVENGSLTDSLVATVPGVDVTGKYWIVAIVDPNNQVEEDLEDDNFPNEQLEEHRNGNYANAVIEVIAAPSHDFSLVDATIDEQYVVLDSPDTHQGTGENHSDIVGHIDAIYHGTASVTANLSAEVMINDVFQKVTLWDATIEDYATELSLNFSYNNAEHYFGFDIVLSEQQRTALYANYDSDAIANEITIRFSISDVTDSETLSSNNYLETTVPLYFFEPYVAQPESDPRSDHQPFNQRTGSQRQPAYRGDLDVSGAFNKGYGKKKHFKVALDLSAELSASLIDRSAALDASGAVEMWILNAKNDIFAVSFEGQGYLSGVNTGYDAEMIVFNSTVYESSKWIAKFEKNFNKTWEEERELAKANFFVGPIPIAVKAGVTGDLGFDLSLGYALSELYANGDIFSTQFHGFANGGVDLLLAEAGITIDLKVIENALTLDSSAGLSLLADGQADPRINYQMSVTDEIDVISGRFGLYADVKSSKWCKKWFIPYPCGISTTTYHLWFYQSPSVFKKEWTIYSSSGAIRP